MPKKSGRPVEFTQELAAEICEIIATTPVGLEKLCDQNKHWPNHRLLWSWLYKYPDFYESYDKAKRFQIDCLVDKAMAIAFDGSKDTYTDHNGKEKCDHEWVHRSKLIVDTIKWQAEKLRRKKYGADKEENEAKTSLLQNIIDKL